MKRHLMHASRNSSALSLGGSSDAAHDVEDTSRERRSGNFSPLASRRSIRSHLQIASLLLAGLMVLGTDPAAGAEDPSKVGKWAPPVKVGAIGIDAILLRTGKVMLFGHPHPGASSKAVVLDPVSGQVTDVTYKKAPFIDFFCSAHSQLADGRILISGGQGYGLPLAIGTDEATIFDPANNSWTRLPPMKWARWYPTSTFLPDGTVLVATGYDDDGVTVVDAMESYNPATNTWKTLPHSADLDIALYAQMTLLPSGKVFQSEPNQSGHLFDPATNKWTFVDDMNYGWRNYGGTVLLPGLNEVLTCGGSKYGINGSANNTAEIIDLSKPSPQWKNIASMKYARWMHNLVLLPDETVLVVGGGKGGVPSNIYANPVYAAELYTPDTGKWSTMAAQKASRTYHSTALLLPDGRVMSAGTDNGGQQQDTVEYYSPTYLFKGARPTITSVPTSWNYGAKYKIVTPDAAKISRVSLIRLGSTTHTNDFDQRYVRLAWSKQSGKVQATAPAAKEIAPLGYYMLFIVNDAGVPGEAKIIRLK
jgi:hypothetical protein